MKAVSLACAVARCGMSAALIALVAACAVRRSTVSQLPVWSFDQTMVFPADSSLARPEDGIALPDGRLIVTDQVHGLRVVETDGSSAPFGDMAAAGYVHRPPDHPGGANGISLEPDGLHLLLTDALYGEIYRIDLVSGAAEMIYAHHYGVNAAVRDSRGTIWFTQSTRNTAAGRMWAALDVPTPDGALLRLDSNGQVFDSAVIVVDSLFFANGVAIDESAGDLYVAETTANRILRFHVDPSTRLLSERTVVANLAADNLELDGEGHLWAAVPLGNQVVVLDTVTGERHTIFHAETSGQKAKAAEFWRRGEAGVSRMELLTPDMWAPLPGTITGVIISPRQGPLYLTGLGKALVRLER